MKIVIITGGNIEEDFALDFLKKNPYDCIIAADRGTEFCHRNHLKVNAVVGDFDSAKGESVEYYELAGVPIRRLKPEKDDSDTQSAFGMAREMGADEIALLGATGTRLDHVWANVQLLARGEELGVRMSLLDACNRVTLHRRSFVLRKEEQFGTYVSFYSLGDSVDELTLTGFKYPLERYHLTNMDSSLTVSNEIVCQEAQVDFAAGILLMIQSRD